MHFKYHGNIKKSLFFFTSRLYLERGLKRLDTFGISYIGMANPIGESTITAIPKAETLLLSRILDLLLDRNKERHSLIETPLSVPWMNLPRIVPQ